MNKVINYIRNNFKFVIVIISIILAINIALMGYLIYRYNHRENYDEKPITIVAENEFTFGNWGELLNVSLFTPDTNTKKLTASKVSSAIEDFATGFIPYINKNVLQNSDTTPEKFFKENKNYIFQHAGISEEKDFITLCNNLKNIECNLDTLCNAYYIENTVEYANNILKVDIRLSDKEGKSMNVHVRTSEKSENRLRYEIIK